MSSYQFVNSLASCYASQSQAQQARSGPSPVDGHHGQHGGGGGSTAASPAGDYYNGNGNYSASPTCYSPQGYPQQGYGHMGNDMMDYTQLHPAQRSQHIQHHMPTSPGPGPAPPTPGGPSGGLLSPAGHGPAAAAAGASCKYENMSGMPPAVTSPQDLSSSGPAKAAAAAKPPASLTSPVTVSTRPSASASPGLNEASPSPASSTSSTSSGNNNNNGGSSKSGGSGGQSGNPPQIYPWMKRVHLGQSESSQVITLWRGEGWSRCRGACRHLVKGRPR